MGKLRCPICRSSQWRKEPSSGMLICSEGHILQGYRKETIEQTEASQHVMRKRTLKRTKQEAESSGQSNLAHYHGSRARFLYLQSLQLVLRLQIAALQKLWLLPKEFEAICKDVWTLHLSLLSNPVESNLQEELMDFRKASTDENAQKREQEENIDEISDSASSIGSSGEEESNGDPDPEGDLAKLLEDVSDSGSDNDDIHPSIKEISSRKKPIRQREDANLTANLAVLMISCWILRIPVTYMDFIRQIREYNLPYLDTIPRGLIPQSMVTHMNKDIIRSISSQRPPRPLQVHRIASRLAQSMVLRYQIVIPEANAPHIVARALGVLHLPVKFYHIIKIMASRISISLNLSPFIGQESTTSRSRRGNNQIGDNIPIEMAFACVIVFSLKLIYCLDGRSSVQLPVEAISLKLPIKQEFLSKLRQSKKQTDMSENRNIMDLSEEELDDYLTFAEKALLGDNIGAPRRETQQDLQSQLPPDSTTSAIDEDTQFPPDTLPRGKHHTIYCSNDILGQLPDEYSIVVSRVARWCGVEDNDIATIVERYERRLLREMERIPKGKSRERMEVADD